MYMYHTGFFFKGDVPSWPMEMNIIVSTLSVQIVVGQGPVSKFSQT